MRATEWQKYGSNHTDWIQNTSTWASTNRNPMSLLLAIALIFNSNHLLKFLDFYYFVILQLLEKNWAKSVHRAQNGGTFKIAPPDFSFINLKDFRNFKDFCKNSNPHIFLIFEDIHSIFCTVTHDNDLIKWCNFRKNRTGVSPVRGCGSLRPPPRNLSCLNTPGLIGLNVGKIKIVIPALLWVIERKCPLDYMEILITYGKVHVILLWSAWQFVVIDNC